MCGLFALNRRRSAGAGNSVDPKALTTMLAHRGPDDFGWLAAADDGVTLGRDEQPRPDWQVYLGHRRLSIIDLSKSGWQPMASADGRYFIVFNGEIYNYVELARELAAEGVEFRSSSDTEVLLQLFIRRGPAALARLTGMFAFCLYDRQERRIYAARDSFGIKPLYLAEWQDGLGLSSEIPPLMELPGLGRSLNPEGVFSFLAYGISDQASTLVKGVRPVLPGTWVEIDIDAARVVKEVRFWEPLPVPDRELSRNDLETDAGHLRGLLMDSIRMHLRADVPVGALLSGGIDSSAIVCAMRELEPKLELHTFTFVAADEARSERKWADIVSGHVRAIPHYITLDHGDFERDSADLFRTQFEPFNALSIYAQYKVFQRIQQEGIKVVLDGQGADELFGGYTRYVADVFLDRVRRGRLGSALALWRSAMSHSDISASGMILRSARSALPTALFTAMQHAAGLRYLPPGVDASWFRANDGVVATPVGDSGNWSRTVSRSLGKTGLSHLLRYEDRNSMRFSVESRVPFLTQALAEFAVRLPSNHAIGDDGVRKAILKRAIAPFTPTAIVNRADKIGFEAPTLGWMRATPQIVEGALEALVQLPFINIDSVRQAANGLLAPGGSDRRDSDMFWRLVSFGWFCRIGGLSA